MEIATFQGESKNTKTLNRLTKIWRGWLRWRGLPTCQNSQRSPHWGRSGLCV